MAASFEPSGNFNTVLGKMSECVHNGGDNPSFEKIFKQHYRRVYVLCFRMTGNAEEAEDLTQEVFVHVFRKLESFREEAAFSPLLHRLTVKRVLMHFRRNSGGKEQTTKDDELPAVPVRMCRPVGRSKSRLQKARMRLRKLSCAESLRGRSTT
jgi:RNA polymerase sigma factor (sigma-70 family)